MKTLLVTAILILLPALVFAENTRGCKFGQILLMPDVSGSLTDSEFKRVRDTIADQLDQVAIVTGASVIAVLPWADGPSCWMTPKISMTLPARPHIAYVEPVRKESDIFAGSWEKKKAKAHEDQVHREEEADTSYRHDVTTSLAPILNTWRALDQGKAPCTPVEESLARCSAERPSTLVILITDGVNDCEPVEQHRVSYPNGAALVVILVPSNGDSEDVGEALEKRRLHIQSTVSSAKVIYSFHLTNDPTDWLLPLITPENMPSRTEQTGLWVN